MADVDKMNEDIRLLKEDLADCKEAYQQLDGQYNDLQTKYDNLLQLTEGGWRPKPEEKSTQIGLQVAISLLFNESRFSDITILLGGGEQLYGHKVILSFSTYNWIQPDFHDTNIQTLDLTDYSYKVGYAVIKYVYTDNFNDSEKEDNFILDVLRVATQFRILRLMVHCNSILFSRMTTNNIKLFQQIAEEICSRQLGEYCQIFLAKHQKNVSDTESINSAEEKMVFVQCTMCDKRFLESHDLDKHLVHVHFKDILVAMPEVCDNGLEHDSKEELTTKTTSKLSKNRSRKTQKERKRKTKEHNFKRTKTKGNNSSKGDNLTKMIQKNNNGNEEIEISPNIWKKNISGTNGNVESEISPSIWKKNISGTYDCGVCGRVFRRLNSLKQHARLHSGVKPYQCDICGRSFTQIAGLQVHRRTHTGEKPYKCDVCGKTCTQKGDLQKHERTHTGQRPYICDVCGKSFISSSQLISHSKIHTGCKAYNCDVCKKSFYSKYHLIRHTRTHSGEKPYHCDLCFQSFAASYNLKRHAKTHSKPNSQIVQKMEESLVIPGIV